MEDAKLDPDYFRKILAQGIRDIFEAQRLIFFKNIYQKGAERTQSKRAGKGMRSRSGALKQALTSPGYRLDADADGVRTQLTYPLYLRFLDMKRHGNWKIYNRQIWGILYSDTFVKMRFGVTQDLRSIVQDALASAVEPLNSN